MLHDVIEKYAKGKYERGDVIVISESAVAITQGRAIPINKMHPSLLSRFLYRFVKKVPYGTGLRNPYSMEAAREEIGSIRLIFAAIIGGITRLFGRKGDFYRIAGKQAAMIDAPHTSPVQPYDKAVIKGPKDADKVSLSLKNKLGVDIAIMDINDIGGSWVIGSSFKDKKSIEKLQDLMRDNPMGQGNELTPICIVKQFFLKEEK